MQCDCLLFSKIAGNRTPDNGGINFFTRHGFNNFARRAVLCIIPKDAVADHVVHNASAAQCMRWRAVGIIIANKMHADLQILKNRVIKGRELISGLFGIHKGIRRTVVRLGRQHGF